MSSFLVFKMLEFANLWGAEMQINLPIEQKRQLLLELACDKELLWKLSKRQLKKISKTVSKVKETKYVRRKQPKYGLFGAKTMDLPEIDAFFSAFRPHEWPYKVLFLTQAFLGLRIGEVVKIKLEDIDFAGKQIKIHTEKQRHYETDLFMVIHEKLEALLLDYINAYEQDIRAHDNYLFFPLQNRSKTKHMSSDQARNFFRRVCERAGLNKFYGYKEVISNGAAAKLWEICQKPKSILELKAQGFTEEKIHKIKSDYPQFFIVADGSVQAKKVKLYRYTTHSLRHAFGKFLAKRGVPIEIAKHLLRHQDIKSTQIYYVPDKEQVDATMRNLFAFRKKY